MNTQITDMFVRAAVEKSRETLDNYSRLSDEQLEEIAGRYIPNPISRTYTRLFVDGRTPTTGQYEIANKILEKRRD